MKNIQFIVNKSELGAGTRGASLGFDALRFAAYNADSTVFDYRNYIEIPNENDLLFEDDPAPTKGIFIDAVYRLHESIIKTLSPRLRRGDFFPFIISGDHSSAAGYIGAIRKAFPEKRLGVIWIDAHGDLHSPYTSPSGNVHGMPLAAALGYDNREYETNTPQQETIDYWEKLKNAGGTSPKISPEDIVFIGIRDLEKEERALIDKNNIKNYLVGEVRNKGTQKIIEGTLEHLKACDHIFISFDVDSMDPDEVSYGTGTPVPNGLTESEATELVCGLLKNPKSKFFEMMEINPLLDNRGNTMAETAFRILTKAVKIIEEK
ncbi:MAG: arginase [Candidatus Kapaibacteriales bacterium]